MANAEAISVICHGPGAWRLQLQPRGLHQLQQACAFACRDDSDLHHLPFAVGPNDLLAALVSTCSSERQPA